MHQVNRLRAGLVMLSTDGVVDSGSIGRPPSPTASGPSPERGAAAEAGARKDFGAGEPR